MSRRTFVLVGALALATVIGGCSSDKYGSLYCPDGPRDTLAVYPEPDLQHITILPDLDAGYDGDPGMAGMESLYLGTDGDTRSSILANFDFREIGGSSFPDSLFTLDNIKSVKLSLVKYRPYHAYAYANDGTAGELTGAPVDLYYLVHQLEAPFDSEDYKVWPGPAAITLPGILNWDFSEPNDFDEPYLKLNAENFLAWRTEGEVGLEIRLDIQSDPGMVGFASRETERYSELGHLYAGTIAAPNLVVEFHEYVDDNQFLLIPPSADTSTFEQVADLPADLIHVQTGLQTASILTYDVPPLPEGTCLTDVGISFFGVEVDSLWTSRNVCLVMASVDSTGLDLEDGFVPADDLKYKLVVQGALCRQEKEKSSSPHLIPGMTQIMVYYPGRDLRGYSYYRDVGDLYFTQNTFYGPSGPEEFRPVLKLIYGKSGD